jgi:branched-subunit amino acid transport protein AzlD
MPSGGTEILFLLVTSLLASKLRNARVLLMIFNTTVAMIGMVLVYSLKDQAGRMSGLAFSAVFAINIPIALSLITSNVSGFTKRSTVSAIMFVAYCLGNICGPQFYLTREAPRYEVCHRSFYSSFCC